MKGTIREPNAGQCHGNRQYIVTKASIPVLNFDLSGEI